MPQTITNIPYKDTYIVRIPSDPDKEDQVLSALDALFGGLKNGACVTLTEDDHDTLMENITRIRVINNFDNLIE